MYDIQNDEYNNKHDRITCAEILKSVKRHLIENKYSNELDILIIYIYGQKHIYSQSYYVTQQKINMLIYSSLLISGSIIFAAPYTHQYNWSGWTISILNVVLSILISMLPFFNLHDRKNKFNEMANQYSKLYQILNMNRTGLLHNSNGLARDTSDTNKIYNKISNSSNRYSDVITENIQQAITFITNIKDDNLMIPTEIKQITPIISNVNIFTFIQKINRKQIELIIQYKEVKNDIRYILSKWKKSHGKYINNTNPIINPTNKLTIYQVHEMERLQETKKLDELIIEKKKLKYKLLSQQLFVDIEQIFVKEIQQSSKFENNFFFIFYSYLYFFNCFLFGSDLQLQSIQQIDDIIQNY